MLDESFSSYWYAVLNWKVNSAFGTELDDQMITTVQKKNHKIFAQRTMKTAHVEGKYPWKREMEETRAFIFRNLEQGYFLPR